MLGQRHQRFRDFRAMDSAARNSCRLFRVNVNVARRRGIANTSVLQIVSTYSVCQKFRHTLIVCLNHTTRFVLTNRVRYSFISRNEKCRELWNFRNFRKDVPSISFLLFFGCTIRQTCSHFSYKIFQFKNKVSADIRSIYINTLSAGNIVSLFHTYSGRKLVKYEKSALFRKHVTSSQLIVGFQWNLENRYHMVFRRCGWNLKKIQFLI